MGSLSETPTLYLTGGRQKPRFAEEWNQYDKAVILKMDSATGEITTVIEYSSPIDVCAGSDASVLFKAGSIENRKLYVPTNTEILIYDLPSFRQAGYLSLPWFNDLHHVCPARNGNLLVVNTGLDMVAEVTPEGAMVREWAVLGGDTWEKFSRDTDYRKVATTKPHMSHPNYVIQSADDIWVGRGMQKDTYCLTQPRPRVEFQGHPHDGVKNGGKVYFTTVNGFLHVLDERTMAMDHTIDLNQIDTREVALGWARAILPINERLCWVGFTRLRPTRFRDNVSWVKHGFKQYYLPTRIALYDLAAKTLLREVDLEPYGLHAIFSILAEPA